MIEYHSNSVQRESLKIVTSPKIILTLTVTETTVLNCHFQGSYYVNIKNGRIRIFSTLKKVVAHCNVLL